MNAVTRETLIAIKSLPCPNEHRGHRCSWKFPSHADWCPSCLAGRALVLEGVLLETVGLA